MLVPVGIMTTLLSAAGSAAAFCAGGDDIAWKPWQPHMNNTPRPSIADGATADFDGDYAGVVSLTEPTTHLFFYKNVRGSQRTLRLTRYELNSGVPLYYHDFRVSDEKNHIYCLATTSGNIYGSYVHYGII